MTKNTHALLEPVRRVALAVFKSDPIVMSCLLREDVDAIARAAMRETANWLEALGGSQHPGCLAIRAALRAEGDE